MVEDNKYLSTAVEDGVLVITFTRPDELNTWSYALHTFMRRAIEAANESADIGAIVITGTGRALCAGADMSAVFGLSQEEKNRARAEAKTHDWVALVRRSKPIVVAVNGLAVGLGVSLFLPVDQIVASPDAKFALRFVKMGLVPEMAASHFVQSRCGFGAASRILLTGDQLSAQEALETRLIDAVFPAETLLHDAKSLARRMGCNPPGALQATKRLLTENASEMDLDVMQQRELDTLVERYASAEHKDAVAAFMAKRTAPAK